MPKTASTSPRKWNSRAVPQGLSVRVGLPARAELLAVPFLQDKGVVVELMGEEGVQQQLPGKAG